MSTGDQDTPRWEASADLVVVGSGVAGLTSALRATGLGLRVLVLSKGEPSEGSTAWAQGGVAVVLPDGPDGDTPDRHVADTLAAGVGLCDPGTVNTVVRAGPAAVADLRELGAVFDRGPDGRLDRTREGGHTAFRVVHAGGDATGAEVERALLSAARGGPAVLPGHTAVEVLRGRSGAVAGLAVLDADGVPGVVRAPAVLLATGGLGQLYRATSNPAVATADGIALALRAGAKVADLEFVQFHPTVLYTSADATGSRPLVTEAVRGEGAVLVDATGARVMDGVHPLGDLAPRDVVSRAITTHLAGAPGGVDDHVFLDATHLAGGAFARRFPTVNAACRRAGIDPGTEPIPVAPAAHFSCGGVLATVHGRTSVPGLYAAGETARTGLHGANRLASNSLLEGLVTGRLAAEAIAGDLDAGLVGGPCAVDRAPLPATGICDRDVVQRVMTRHAGIGRDAGGLAAARAEIEARSVSRPLSSRRLVEDAALTLAATTLLAAAAHRAESRGCHQRLDHPGREDEAWGRSTAFRLDVFGEPIAVDAPSLGAVA
ncbi:L-aspartate oxidase [Actinoalloteichus spitiensis]|uniref:L-aspartate oxidase n=1 Tax=Actinoalloteichus spitiensis TaxID=252394 RepID=UPI00035E7BCC|nr:L-aspartate oxidase [Actinoalloteichus spitiensis]